MKQQFETARLNDSHHDSYQELLTAGMNHIGETPSGRFQQKQYAVLSST